MVKGGGRPKGPPRVVKEEAENPIRSGKYDSLPLFSLSFLWLFRLAKKGFFLLSLLRVSLLFHEILRSVTDGTELDELQSAHCALDSRNLKR